jgi:23S rRNA (adenine2503-C2)-methyltransferase
MSRKGVPEQALDPARSEAASLGASTGSPERTALVGMSIEEIARALGDWEEPPYRARQLYEWVYARRAREFARMSSLPAPLRNRLAASFHLLRPAILGVQASSDGTRKHLLGVKGGRLEAVTIPEPSRVTFCISSQIGCALDCRFCLTAQMGFGRHLNPGEIIAQVLLLLDDPGIGGRPVNIVFMGMGEPLHNYEAVMRAFRILADPSGIGIPRRRITLSTAGVVPAIRRLAKEAVRPRLAISLNAATDELRSRIMPIGRKYPLVDLMDAAASFPLPPRERLTFEYVLLDGINASPSDADRLAGLFRRYRIRAKVNLIPFNPGGGLPYEAPSKERCGTFRDTLLASGIPCSIRANRGRDISAACGQLAVVEGEDLASGDGPSI